MKVNILWSGGFDSTFLLLHQLDKGYTVQPFYIEGRRSNKVYSELIARQRIRYLIDNIKLRPTRILKLGELEVKKTIYDAMKANLVAGINMSLQSAKFVAAATMLNFTLQVGACKDDSRLGSLWQKEHGIEFPLEEMSKQDMWIEAGIRKWQDIMKETWSCFNAPYAGFVCGECDGCKKRII